MNDVLAGRVHPARRVRPGRSSRSGGGDTAPAIFTSDRRLQLRRVSGACHFSVRGAGISAVRLQSREIKHGCACDRSPRTSHRRCWRRSAIGPRLGDNSHRTAAPTSRDPLDGVNGTTIFANPCHSTDNDPLDKVDPMGERARDWGFRDPCWSTGGSQSQPKGGYGARPFSELDQIGYIDLFDLGYQAAFGCVPLPPGESRRDDRRFSVAHRQDWLGAPAAATVGLCQSELVQITWSDDDKGLPVQHLPARSFRSASPARGR